MVLIKLIPLFLHQKTRFFTCWLGRISSSYGRKLEAKTRIGLFRRYMVTTVRSSLMQLKINVRFKSFMFFIINSDVTFYFRRDNNDLSSIVQINLLQIFAPWSHGIFWLLRRNHFSESATELNISLSCNFVCSRLRDAAFGVVYINLLNLVALWS